MPLGVPHCAWCLRFVIFDPKTNVFSYYGSEHDAMLDRERRGAVTVATTILYADRFAFYTDEVRHASNTADHFRSPA